MTTLLFLVLQVTAILALASLIARAFLSRSPQLTADVCFLGLALSVASIPLASLPIPKLAVGSFSSWQASETTSADRPDGENASSRHTDASRISAAVPGPQTCGINFLGLLAKLGSSTAPNTESPTTFLACLACWGVLVALGAIKLAMALPTVWRLRRKSKALYTEQLQEKLSVWAQQHAALDGLELRVSDRVTSPCVTWLDRKTIYLPESFVDWPTDEQLAVLAHEAAHLLRRDAQWRLAFDILRQVVNCHPLAWVLKRQFVLAQEISADRKADQLLSAGRYQKGLCKLALRMDAQPQLSHASLGVSVSTNSLVRRIKMLSMPNRRQLSRWQQFAIVACVTTLSGGVALCTADEPIRVASRAKKSPASPAPFTRYTSQPWEEIGVQSGYFRVLPSVAAQRPMIKAALESVAQDLNVADLACGVDWCEDWNLAVANLEVDVQESPADRRTNGRYELSASMSTPVLQFVSVVDWEEVASNLRIGAFSIPENREAVKKFIASQGRSKTLRMATNSTDSFRGYLKAKSLWSNVDGGVIAAVLDLANFGKIDPKYDNGICAAMMLEVAQMCSYAGVGVDFVADDLPCQVRLAFVPGEYSATAVAEQSKIALAAILDLLKNTEGMSAEAKSIQSSWRRELKTWKVTTKEADDQLGEIVLIEGAISDASLLFLNKSAD